MSDGTDVYIDCIAFNDIISTCAFHVLIFLFRIEILFAHANMRACVDVDCLGLFPTAYNNNKNVLLYYLYIEPILSVERILFSRTVTD